MGRERARQRQYFHFCLALLIWLSGCSLWQESTRQRDLRAAVQTGNRLLAEGNFDGSLSAFEGVAAAARNEPPGDAAVYKSGLIYAHPDNPKRDLHKAHEKFSHLLSAYPARPWVEQARVWVELLKESEEWKREAEQSRKEVEKWQLELEKNRAPVTTANFLRYVDQKRFDGSNFYRAMKLGEGFGLIQAGA